VLPSPWSVRRYLQAARDVSDLREAIRNIFDRADEPFNALWKWATEPAEPERRAERFEALEKWAGSHKRQEEHDSEEWKAWRQRQRVYRKRARLNRDRADENDSDVPGLEDGGWHPDAIRTQVHSGIGQMSGPPKLVWHTTEGYGLPSYSGSHPHFTIDPATGKLYQHVPITSGAYALQNLSGGVETNRDGAIQVEIIGFASRMASLPESHYDHLADLARWIERHCRVPRKCGVRFIASASGATRMSGGAWDGYAGHLGHQHVPENDHWDPGGFRIGDVLA
jgi:hypothetical protein